MIYRFKSLKEIGWVQQEEFFNPPRGMRLNFSSYSTYSKKVEKISGSSSEGYEIYKLGLKPYWVLEKCRYITKLPKPEKMPDLFTFGPCIYLSDKGWSLFKKLDKFEHQYTQVPFKTIKRKTEKVEAIFHRLVVRRFVKVFSVSGSVRKELPISLVSEEKKHLENLINNDFALSEVSKFPIWQLRESSDHVVYFSPEFYSSISDELRINDKAIALS